MTRGSGKSSSTPRATGKFLPTSEPILDQGAPTQVSELRYTSKSRAACVALLAAICVIVACQPASGDGVVVGHVVDVKAVSLVEFESLTIVDDDGTKWVFSGGEFPGFTPSHLEEHQALGEPVKVFYETEEDGSLRIVRIEDG